MPPTATTSHSPFFWRKNLYRACFYIVELDQGSFPDELTSVIDDGGGGNDDGDDNNYNDEGDDSDHNDDGPTDQPTNVQLAFPKIKRPRKRIKLSLFTNIQKVPFEKASVLFKFKRAMFFNI